MPRDIKVEIFAVGKWNGFEFTKEDLIGIAVAYNKLMEIHQVPLKMGHNDEQPMTDGQPALGWVGSVDVENDKLVANFTDVPDIVANAIESKLYRNVSIELDMGVEHKGDYYPFVLSGVALLGADIPAVNTLSDLQAYMTSNKEPLKFSKKLTFTMQQGDGKMPKTLEEIQAELDAVKAENAKLVTDKVKFKAKADELEAAEAQRVEAAKKLAFSNAKGDLTAQMDELVKSDKMTPAQRDKFAAEIIDEVSLDRVKFAVDAFAETKGATKMDNTPSGENGSGVSTEDDLLLEIEKLQVASPNLTFTQARERVFKANPDAAKAYAMKNGGVQ